MHSAAWVASSRIYLPWPTTITGAVATKEQHHHVEESASVGPIAIVWSCFLLHRRTPDCRLTFLASEARLVLSPRALLVISPMVGSVSLQGVGRQRALGQGVRAGAEQQIAFSISGGRQADQAAALTPRKIDRPFWTKSCGRFAECGTALWLGPRVAHASHYQKLRATGIVDPGEFRSIT